MPFSFLKSSTTIQQWDHFFCWAHFELISLVAIKFSEHTNRESNNGMKKKKKRKNAIEIYLKGSLQPWRLSSLHTAHWWIALVNCTECSKTNNQQQQKHNFIKSNTINNLSIRQCIHDYNIAPFEYQPIRMDNAKFVRSD